MSAIRRDLDALFLREIFVCYYHEHDHVLSVDLSYRRRLASRPTCAAMPMRL